MKSKSIKLPPLVYKPPQDPLNILYQDDDIIVLSKPSGLLSVPGKSEDHQDSLETRVRSEFPNVRLIHRLDLETSGVFIMAMHKQAQAHINLQFEKRKTKKQYVARVWGRVEQDSGHVDLPLRTDWKNRPRQMVCYEHGRSSQTDWEVLEREESEEGYDITRILLKPITGRSHQLRVHMAEIGHPILGDVFYAHDDAENLADRLQLHAEKLTIYHPKDNSLVTFDDPIPF